MDKLEERLQAFLVIADTMEAFYAQAKFEEVRNLNRIALVLESLRAAFKISPPSVSEPYS